MDNGLKEGNEGGVELSKEELINLLKEGWCVKSIRNVDSYSYMAYKTFSRTNNEWKAWTGTIEGEQAWTVQYTDLKEIPTKYDLESGAYILDYPAYIKKLEDENKRNKPVDETKAKTNDILAPKN
jgi:hypothetical protein